MTGSRAIAGLCMLCALAFSAIAAQGASAATNGTTAFTCKVPTGGDVAVGGAFSDAHCNVPNGAGTFRHVQFAEETTTELTGTSEDTSGTSIPSKLKSVQSGVTEELQSPLAHIVTEPGKESWLKNRKDPVTGEHYIEGTVWVRYTEVSVAAPAGKGCKVKGGQVTTNMLNATTKGQGMAVKFEPGEGEPFATFVVEGCTGSKALEALNHEYTVTGSLKATVEGATISTTHTGTTEQGTLKVFGQTGGLEGKITVKGKDAVDASDTALSATTVETP